MRKYRSDKDLRLPTEDKKIILVNLQPGVMPHEPKPKWVTQNLFKEYIRDLGFPRPKHCDLRPWRNNGIEFMQLDYDRDGGALENWQRMTRLSERRDRLCFVLFGWRANKMRPCIDENKHLVIPLKWPSPMRLQKDLPPIVGSSFYTRACAYVNLVKAVWKLP